MKPDISEFSYGYALTDELVHWHSTPLSAAPVFPSLYNEGKPGGGYDLKLEQGGVPLFLQFKLADRMVRSTVKEVKDGHFSCPFFRMHLRPKRHSNQHEMLLDLELKGAEVYYAAPAFDQLEDLNDAYLTHNVLQRSLWVRPSYIGPLLDDADHHLAFNIPGPLVVCSEPRRIEFSADYKTFLENIERAVERRSETALSDRELAEFADSMEEIGERRRGIAGEQKMQTRIRFSNRRPLDRIAAYSSMYFGTQLFIVTKREVETIG